MGPYNKVNTTYAPVLRTAGWQQSDTGLLWVPPGFTHVVRSAAGGIDRSVQRNGIHIKRFELHNRSGGAAGVGIGGRIANKYWIAGTLTSDGATFTQRDGYKAQTATIFGADADVNDGVVILSRVPFNAVSVNITTAEVDAGAAVDHTVQYSTGATWTTLGANAAITDGFTLTNTVYALAVHDLVMFSPSDWTKTAGNGGTPDGYYGVRFTSAQMGAGDTAAIATGIEIFDIVAIEALADNGIWEQEVVDYWMPYCDGLVAYFSTANAGNRVYAEVTTR